MSRKTILLISLPLGLFSGVLFAALAGVSYEQAQAGSPPAMSGGTALKAPPASAVASATEGSGGGSNSTASVNTTKGTPSQKGNINAVSSILHPEAKQTKVEVGPPEPMLPSDVENRIIDNSINSYNGPCACPYSRNADGFECGVEAAYYKPGGFRIYCYPEDVRGQLHIFYRKTH